MAPKITVRHNTKRVAAGRQNRLKRGPLTDEGRARLRAAALANRPWERSTGPTTPQGKVQAIVNGKKRQRGALSVRELRGIKAQMRIAIRGLRELRITAGVAMLSDAAAFVIP